MSEEVKEVVVEQTSTTAAPEVVVEEVKKVEEVKTEPEVKVAEAPQEIKYDLKLSEGSLLDKARIDEVLAEAKQGKLTNEQAQSLLQREEQAVDKYQKALEDQVEKNKTEWLKQLESDKDVGGAKWKENAETAHLFLKQHADQGMMDFLNKSGLGNNPSVFKFVLKLANMAKPDQMVNGGQSTHQVDSEQARLDRMYPKTKI